jgi:hypothetical protein
MADRKIIDRQNVLTSWPADLCITVWAGLAAVAFWVRLTEGSKAASSITIFGDSPPPAPALDAAPDTLQAWVFLALYAGSGVVAFVGAFLSHNPFATARAQAEKTIARLRAVEPEAKELHEKATLLQQEVDGLVADIKKRWGASRDERVEIVSAVPIAAAHVALRSKFGGL